MIYDKILKLEIVLENTESFSVSNEHIGICFFEDIIESFHNAGINAFHMSKNAKTVILEIHKDADYKETKTAFDSDFFERITRHHDIKYFRIWAHEQNDPKSIETHAYTIFNAWNPENEYKNSYQKTYIRNGNLYIIISKENIEMDFDGNIISLDDPDMLLKTHKDWIWERD